ncbi:transposase [Streptomyces sp. RPT161]|uniref:transposase n=1 Tax=Streptomyces sp. RPT161 TaxID=3015993 RepID=UPI0022B8B49F|nr:transposase [Streptomyces sp. RPT161]
MDGTLVPTRDHNIAERSKNYRYLTNHQVVIDADTRFLVAVGQAEPGNRNDCKGVGAVRREGRRQPHYRDRGRRLPRHTGLVIPHRRESGGAEVPAWKEEHNASHRKIRARVEHASARIKGWKLLGGCRLKGDGVHHAMLDIARLHNLTVVG